MWTMSGLLYHNNTGYTIKTGVFDHGLLELAVKWLTTAPRWWSSTAPNIVFVKVI